MAGLTQETSASQAKVRPDAVGGERLSVARLEGGPGHDVDSRSRTLEMQQL